MAMFMHQLRNRPGGWTREQAATEFDAVPGPDLAQLRVTTYQVRPKLIDILRQIRVLCLTDLPGSPRMWREYAKEGTGICVGLQYVPEIDNVIGAARRVEYFDQPPPIATPREWARHILGITDIQLGARAHDTLYLKNYEKYGHEREWRLITMPKPGSTADRDGIHRVTIDPGEIVEVILGPSMERAAIEEVRLAVDRLHPGVAIRTAAWSGRDGISISD